jgi:hypothetical protein
MANPAEAPDLSGASMNDLLNEALRRNPDELRESEGRFAGMLTMPAFKTAALLATRQCVDGVPVRSNLKTGNVELMAIQRNTLREAGKLCCVGGGVGFVKDERFTDQDGNALWVPRTNEEALKGHFRTDLGWGIELLTPEDQPQYFAQDMKPVNGEIKDGMLPNPNENAHAARYLVAITDGDPDRPVYGEGFGGQEAKAITWFSEDEMPQLDAFGYNHGLTYRRMFEAAGQLTDILPQYLP